MNNPNWTCGGIYTRPTDSCLFLRVSRKRGHDIPADAEDNQKDKRLASTHACSFWVKVIPDLWLQFISYWNPPLQPVRVESARRIERSVSEQARRAVWPLPELLYCTCSTEQKRAYPFCPSRAYLWQRLLTSQAWDRLLSNPPGETQLGRNLLTIWSQFLVYAFCNDLLVLGQYGFLDHPSRFSVGRKSNIPIGAVVQLLGGK